MRDTFGSPEGWAGLLKRFAGTVARALMFVAIAIHHAAPEHVEDFLAFMGRVVQAVGRPPGLIDFDGYRDQQSNRLIGLSRWESEQAFRDALPLIGSLAHERREEWSERPDDVLLLSPA